MATYNYQITKTYKAAVDLSASQYYLVKAGSVDGECNINGTLSGSVIGVLQNDPKAGEEATVCVYGFTKVYANTESGASPLTYGGWVKSGSHGQAIGCTNITNASMYYAGIAQEALATGCGVLVEILFTGPMRTGA